MQNPDTLNQIFSRIDTLYIDRVDPALQQQYFNILESTNNQLNSSYTPLVLTTTILTALIGLGAIGAGYFIWRQGKEFKERQNEILEELASSKNEYIEITGSIRDKEKTFNKILNDVKKTLIENGKFNPDQTTTIETTINEASKRVKKDIPGKFSSGFTARVICQKCKKPYKCEFWIEEVKTTKELLSSEFESTCPNCNHTQKNKDRN